MNVNCYMCNTWIFNAKEAYIACDECTKQCQKIGDDTYNWLMRLIENRIEREIDRHTSDYEHTRGD